MPRPLPKDIRRVNAASRRAKTEADLEIRICPVALPDLALFGHTDAAFGNAARGGTQGGYIIGAGDRRIVDGTPGTWSPLTWRSGRLKRVTSSTLAAEGQSALQCARELDWVKLVLLEFVFGGAAIHDKTKYLKLLAPLTEITDCKSLYDQVTAPTLASGRDKENMQDALMLRSLLARTQGSFRWAPGLRQLADALTKDQADCSDTLRSALRLSTFNLGDEATALEERAAEKGRRLERGKLRKDLNEKQMKNKKWSAGKAL
jgi:hypothetical protein